MDFHQTFLFFFFSVKEYFYASRGVEKIYYLTTFFSVGKTIGVSVVAVLKQSNIESEPSRQVHITCPKRPPPPHISQQPLHKHGSVLIAWDKPGGFRRAVAQEGITSYRSVTV